MHIRCLINRVRYIIKKVPQKNGGGLKCLTNVFSAGQLLTVLVQKALTSNISM
jgi:hypothetical protein